jgi:hypothetical protein
MERRFRNARPNEQRPEYPHLVAVSFTPNGIANHPLFCGQQAVDKNSNVLVACWAVRHPTLRFIMDDSSRSRL